MTQGHLDRSKAVRLAGASKIAFGAVVGCGIAGAMLLGRGEITSPQGPLTLVELPPLSNAQSTAVSVTSVDQAGIVERFDLIANAPAKPATVSTDESTSPPPPPPPADSIEYLGQIGFGSGRLALVRHNSVQRIVATGEAVGAFTIVEITPPKLIVQEGERRTEIDLKAKSSDVLSRTGGAAGINAAGFTANAGTASDPATIAARRAAAVRAQQLGQVNANGVKANPNNAAQQAFQAGLKGAKAAAALNPTGTGAFSKPNSPEGFQARFDAVMERLKATGQFQSEEDMIEAAKKLMKAEEGDQ